MHLKFDRGLSISLDSGVVSSLISCLIYGVYNSITRAVYGFNHYTLSPTEIL